MRLPRMKCRSCAEQLALWLRARATNGLDVDVDVEGARHGLYPPLVTVLRNARARARRRATFKL